MINVTTNPAETLGVQGFPAMMNAEQFIVDNHCGRRSSPAAADGVTVLASSGDFGTANIQKTPVKNLKTIPFPRGLAGLRSVRDWRRWHLPVHQSGDRHRYPFRRPADQLPDQPAVREIVWVDSGGDFSHVFATPSYQDTLSAGSAGSAPCRRARCRLPGQLSYRGPGLRHRSRRRGGRPCLPQRR